VVASLIDHVPHLAVKKSEIRCGIVRSGDVDPTLDLKKPEDGIAAARWHSFMKVLQSVCKIMSKELSRDRRLEGQ